MLVLPIVFLLLLGVTDHNRQYNKELAADRLEQLECEHAYLHGNYHTAINTLSHEDIKARGLKTPEDVREICAPKKYP